MVGGTFSVLHSGHRLLLERAFAVADEVHIGLTADAFASSSRKYAPPPYDERYRALSRYLTSFGKPFHIFPIEDPWGPAVHGDYDVIVVSEETKKRAWELNVRRVKAGRPPLRIEVVPLVFGEDLIPLKSERVVRGEISADGKRLTPLRVGVGSTNPVKVGAVEEVFKKVLKTEVIVESVEVDPGVPHQPFQRETFLGAVGRATGALEGRDLGVGIEAGLIYCPELGDYFDVQYCAIADSTGLVSIGHGSGFQYPLFVLRGVMSGEEVGKVMSAHTGIENLGRKQGAIGYLSRGVLDRKGLTEQAVLMALIPRMNASLYSIEQFYRP